MSNKGSGRSDMMGFASALAYIAMVLSIVLLILGALVPDITHIVGLVKDLALLAAVAIPAYYFTRGKAKWIKICYFIALICFIVAAVFGNNLIKL